MAAMRRKDRRGPRMTTVCADATDGSVPEGGEKASAAVSAKDVPLLTQRYSRTPRQAVSARRGKFIAVASSEPWTLRQLRADRTSPSYGVGRGNISTVLLQLGFQSRDMLLSPSSIDRKIYLRSAQSRAFLEALRELTLK